MPNGQNILGSNKNVKGDRNNITGSNATVVGNFNNVVGSNADVKGNDNNVTGSNSDVKGNRNTVTGSYVTVVGDNNIVKGTNIEIKGNNNQYNDPNAKILGMGNKLIKGPSSSSSGTSVDIVNGNVVINGMGLDSMFRIGSMSAGGNTTMTFGSGGFNITQPGRVVNMGIGATPDFTSRVINFGSVVGTINNARTAPVPSPPARDREEPTVFPEAVEEASCQDNDGLCFICTDRKAIVASNPCGHMICVKCCLTLKTTGQKVGIKHACPQCRSAVTRFTRLFFN